MGEELQSILNEDSLVKRLAGIYGVKSVYLEHFTVKSRFNSLKPAKKVIIGAHGSGSLTAYSLKVKCRIKL